MPIEAGQNLLHYRLVSKIGEGGMGVVWKGTDTTLGRDVAIKILPDAFSQDPDRLARFEREARLLAALNHPHIATVHGLHEAGGVRFLAMELVAGEDLARVIARGPVPPEEACDIARQTAAALEAAHDHGVIHRDLKPANIKVTPEGKVKVLDFGLAKSFEAGSVPSDLSPTLSPTMTAAGTQAGVILGTAAYMAPEQARARPVDRRADIWALGCVLYEMLTGQRAFSGDTTTDLLASVVKDEPAWDRIPEDTPRRARDLVRRCLVKDPANRLRDAGDARLELTAALSDPDEVPATAGPAPLRPVAAWIAAALVVGAANASAGWWLSGALDSNAASARVTKLSLPLPEGLYAEDKVRISPDGRVVAFRAVGRPGHEASARLYVRPLDEDRARAIPNSEGVGMIAFSPGGEWIAFEAPIARESSRRRLHKAAVSGGSPPIAIADWDPAWQTGSFNEMVWMPDGDILVMTLDNPQVMVRIDSDTGAIRSTVSLAADAEGNYGPHSVLPGGGVLAVRSTWDGGYRRDPVIIDTTTGAVTLLTEDGARSVLSSTGHLVFSRHDQLLAAPFDPAGGRLLAGPVSILGGLRSDGYSFLAWFDLSRDGTLVYLPGGEVGLQRRLILVSGDGTRAWADDDLRIPAGNLISVMEVSGDGRWLAVTIMNEDGLFEVWGSEIARPSLRRLAAFPALDCNTPRWSRDATKLIMACSGGSHVGGIYMLDMTAPGEPRIIASNTPGQPVLLPLSVAPDASEVLVRKGVTQGNEVLALDLAGDSPAEPRRVLGGTGVIRDARYSADGSRIAYVSNESGRLEVTVRQRHRDGSLGPPVPVASGSHVIWGKGAGGATDLYVWKESEVVERYTIDDAMKPAGPAVVPFVDADLRVISWDILPDGTFLVASLGDDETPPRSLSVVLNFNAELDRLVTPAP